MSVLSFRNFMLAMGAILVALSVTLNVIFLKGELNEHTNQNNELTDPPCPAHLVRKKSPEKNGGADVIIYSVQFDEPSIGGQGVVVSKLAKSLHALHTNYVREFPCDVIVFYGEGAPPDADLVKSLQSLYNRLQFRELQWHSRSVPDDFQSNRNPQKQNDSANNTAQHWGLDQWMTVKIWSYLSNLGYSHVMRMHVDSIVLSPINYNIFDFMQKNKKRFAFRQPTAEANHDVVTGGLYELVDDYLKAVGPGVVDLDASTLYKENPFMSMSRSFFIAEISLFLVPPASDLLRVIEKSQKFYDGTIQSLIVRLFVPPSDVLWLRDFTFQHHKTVFGRGEKQGCLASGGISRGINTNSEDEWSDFAESFESHFQQYQCKKLVRTRWFVGGADVESCEHPSGVICASYLNKVSTKPQNIDRSVLSLGPELWHSSVLGMYEGTAFGEVSSCGITETVAEWNICWTPIARDLAVGRCVVYSFGIAADDPFTNYMADAGCQVFAFDPAQNHPRDYKPNVTFYQYGLVSGIKDENSYNHVGWGSTSSAQYKTLREIQEELGHTKTSISALKIDCEGCEWKLFADIDDESLSRIDQILTEFHFTTSLRFDGNIAQKYAQKSVERLKKYFRISRFAENDGAWYDRFLDERVAASGIQTIPQIVREYKGKYMVSNTRRCCSEMTLIKRALNVTSSDHVPVQPKILELDEYKFNPAPEEMANAGTDVIVYLAQFGQHSSYGKQSMTGASKLEKSLETLYTNYVNEFPCDVIVFYGADNDPDPNLFRKLQEGRPGLQFRQLKGKFWELPHGLKSRYRFNWLEPRFSVGYRHMIRWYAYLIWPYLTSCGYTHVMRMDDDSYIYSKIKYNLFEYMRQHGKRYAFRQPVIDTTGELELRRIVLGYLRSNMSIGQKEQRQDYMKLPTLGFYNNWFIADMSFFLTSPVSTLLQIIDESDIMYTNRTNDLLIQSVMVRLFLGPREIKWFNDFTYEHMTVLGPKNCPVFGGLSYGYGTNLSEWKTITQHFLDRFLHCGEIYNTTLEYSSDKVYACIGSTTVCGCELLTSNCGYYLKKLSAST